MGQPSEEEYVIQDSGNGNEETDTGEGAEGPSSLSLLVFLYPWILQLKKGKKLVMGQEWRIQNFTHFHLWTLLLLMDLNILLLNPL